MYREKLIHISYFSNKTHEFIASIGPHLKPIDLQSGEKIFCKGDPAEEIYFIKKGKVSYINKDPIHGEVEFSSINEGYYFGEVDILFNSQKRLYTAIASKDTELLLLPHTNMKDLYFKEFKDCGKELKRNAELRQLRLRKVYNSHLKNLKSDQKNLPKKFHAKNTFLDLDDPNNDTVQIGYRDGVLNLFPEICSKKDEV
jgi:CRP-like cAMP-binding protein